MLVRLSLLLKENTGDYLGVFFFGSKLMKLRVQIVGILETEFVEIRRS